MLFAIGLIVGLIAGVAATYVYLDNKFQKSIEGVLNELDERLSELADE